MVNNYHNKVLLTDALEKLGTHKDFAAFLEDLLTEEEMESLAQRLKIAKQIINGKTYEEIEKEVGASTTTISRVGQALKYGRGGLQKVFTPKGGDTHAS